MSVTFSVVDSPVHSVTHTYGEEGDGETDTFDEDVLPTCNFSNSNAYRVLDLFAINLDQLGWAGSLTVDECIRLRDCIESLLTTRSYILHDPSDVTRLFRLHTVLSAAAQYGKPVSFG